MSIVKIDLDTKIRNENTYKNLIKRFAKRLYKFMVITRITDIDIVSVKKTRHGLHIQIYFGMDFDDKDILFIQAILLSDFKRELNNWQRVRRNETNWNVLFGGKFEYDFRKKKLTKISDEQEFYAGLIYLEQIILTTKKKIEEFNEYVSGIHEQQ